MATLEKIRGKAGLLIVVVGLALFAFIIGDFLRSGSTFFRQSQEVVLDIDGEKIKIYDYQQRLHEMETLAERNGTQMTDEQRAAINNQLAQQYIQDYVLEQEAGKLGLAVSADELLALIIGDGVQPSMIAQQFLSQYGINSTDKVAVNDFLNQISDKQIKTLPADQQSYVYAIQNEWRNVEKQIKDTRLQEKLAALLTRSYAINDIDAKYESGVPNREIALVQAPISVIGDANIKATDEEVKKYYDEHKEFFVQKYPSTIVQYIRAQVVPSAQDLASAETEMQKTRTEMLQQNDMEALARNYSEKFVAPSFLTPTELDRMNLGASITEFIKTAAIGEVNTPILENNHYSLVKLMA
ncbi:peptidylprolyl isomerase, partial [Porphyromonas loveana]